MRPPLPPPLLSSSPLAFADMSQGTPISYRAGSQEGQLKIHGAGPGSAGAGSGSAGTGPPVPTGRPSR